MELYITLAIVRSEKINAKEKKVKLVRDKSEGKKNEK
jgi:hypothetical protein